MAMRAVIPALALGLGLVGLSGCVDGSDPYSATGYRTGPTTTTTTTVVRDGYGNPLSTAETVRDANGNAVGSSSPGVYQSGPVYYQNTPGYSPGPYRRY
jgi:hypothetical protein